VMEIIGALEQIFASDASIRTVTPHNNQPF
jgi:hypothetical protein